MFDLDQAVSFTLPTRNVRGRAVRLGPVLDDILKAHAYPPVIERLLVEALVLTALFGAMLKGEGGQLTLQAQNERGVVKLLVCDYRDGELRGYIKYDPDILKMYGKNPSLQTLMGQGAYLAITFDQAGASERYQGIVPLDGSSLADAAEYYFAQSEQIPSLVRIAVTHEAEEGAIGGGILLQHLPEGEVGRERLHVQHDEPDWTHVRILGQTVKTDELANQDLPLEQLVWRLFHEEGEIRSMGVRPLLKGCRCDLSHIREVLSQFPADERSGMADENGIISVDCAFCAKIFPINFDGPDVK